MAFSIMAPKGCKKEDIKIESKITNNVIETIVTYPNGFTIKSIINGDKQTVIPSGKLIDLGNGDFQVPN